MITNYKMFEDIRKGADYYDGRFFVDIEQSYKKKFNLVKDMSGSYIKYGMYSLRGWAVTFYNDTKISTDPYEYRWENSGDKFEKLGFLTAEELYQKYPDECIKIYEKVNPMKLKHPGIVRYKKYIEALEKSTSLMVRIESKKYNL